MKVKELRDATSHLRDDATISFKMASGCCGEYEDLCPTVGFEFEIYDDSFLMFYFDALPGYQSCRQVSETLEADKVYWQNLASNDEE